MSTEADEFGPGGVFVEGPNNEDRTTGVSGVAIRQARERAETAIELLFEGREFAFMNRNRARAALKELAEGLELALAALEESAENLAGDVFLHDIDDLDTKALLASVECEKERMLAALSGVAGVLNETEEK